MDTIISFVAIITIGALAIWTVDGCYKINEEEGKKKEGKNMSKKIYKGYELIKAIADGEIKEGSRFKVKALWNGSYVYDNRIAIVKYKNIVYEEEEEIITSWTIINSEFELIEDETIDDETIDDETIDIESISELYSASDTDDTINELVKAVKQLDRRIKKLENKEYCQVCGVELTEENRYMNGMCNDCKYGEE